MKPPMPDLMGDSPEVNPSNVRAVKGDPVKAGVQNDLPGLEVYQALLAAQWPPHHPQAASPNHVVNPLGRSPLPILQPTSEIERRRPLDSLPNDSVHCMRLARIWVVNKGSLFQAWNGINSSLFDQPGGIAL